MPTLPATAPFAPEQIALLNGVFAASSAVQRAWLAGYLAGVDAAAATAAVPAAPAAPKPKLTILYATESGNAEALAAKAKADAAKRGFAARIADIADTDLASLTGAVIAIISTWGDGEPPQRAAPFFRALMSEAAPRLDGVKFAVLALGDSSYAQFCETGKQFDARLAALGATRVAARIDLDLDYEAPAKTWLTTTLEALAPAKDSVIHVDFLSEKAKPALEIVSKTNPFAAEVTANGKLTSERADSETFHVEFSLGNSGITYEPGDALAVVPENDAATVSAIRAAAGLPETLTDALTRRYDITTLTAKHLKDYAALTGDNALAALAEDPAKRTEFLAGRQLIDLLETFPHRIAPDAFTALLRPIAPRYYSIASSQKLVGEEAHLTVARVAYLSAGRARTGVASNMIAHLREGSAAQIFVRPNPHFRLPAEAATPIIMIGAGTGIAPYRGFLQELEATNAANPTWLIFGHRKFLYDFLYQLEIQAWLQSGILNRLDLASSRDQPEKRYVQHVLWEQRDRLTQQLADGATIYLCGDAKHMARDVDATLARILGGQAAVDALITAGRYKKDVY
jgi:sulfite reductase (NADPH) flavoprotein alpha-component